MWQHCRQQRWRCPLVSSCCSLSRTKEGRMLHQNQQPEEDGQQEDKVCLLLDDGARLEYSRKQLASWSRFFRAMFSQGWRESNQQEVEVGGVTGDQLMEVVAYASHDKQLPVTDLGSILRILRTSDCLDFASVRESCISALGPPRSTGPYRCLPVLQACLDFGLTQPSLLTCALNTARWYLPSLQGFEWDVRCLSWEALLSLLQDPQARLDCQQDATILANTWAKGCQRRMKLVEEAGIRGLVGDTPVPREPPFQPCIAGVSNNDQTVVIYTFNMEAGTLDKLAEITGEVADGKCRLHGHYFISHGKDVYITGGEYKFGYSIWNEQVRHCDFVLDPSNWTKVTCSLMANKRRHHSCCIVGDKLYLVGGYGRHRLPVDTLDRLCLRTGKWRSCGNVPNPTQMSIPAVSCFRVNQLLLFRSSSEANVYDTVFGEWMNLHVEKGPGVGVVAFRYAVPHPNGSVYLVVSHSAELMASSQQHGTWVVERVGRFKGEEVQGMCLVRDLLYAFTSSEDEGWTVEMYDPASQTFEVRASSTEEHPLANVQFEHGSCFVAPVYR